MQATRTGFILYCRNYAACRAFYEETLGLPVLFDKPDLVCFAMGGSYLMVEVDDQPVSPARNESHISCLRFNVPNVRAVADTLEAAGVDVDYSEHSWGIIAKFRDPDGNLIGVKDDATFEALIGGPQPTSDGG